MSCSHQVSWRRENYAVLPTGGSQYRGNILTIPSVNKEDRGTYYCVAENGVGKGKRRNIAVEVEFAPVVTVPRQENVPNLRLRTSYFIATLYICSHLWSLAFIFRFICFIRYGGKLSISVLKSPFAKFEIPQTDTH